MPSGSIFNPFINSLPFGTSGTGPFNAAVNSVGSANQNISSVASLLNALGSQVPLEFTPQEQSEIYGSTIGPVQDQSNAAAQRIADVASRTGAVSSLAPSLMSLGHKTASDIGRAGGKLADMFARFPAQELEALSRSIYTPELGAFGREGSTEAGLAGRLAPYAYRPTFGTALGESALGGALGTGMSALGSWLQGLLNGGANNSAASSESELPGAIVNLFGGGGFGSGLGIGF